MRQHEGTHKPTGTNAHTYVQSTHACTTNVLIKTHTHNYVTGFAKRGLASTHIQFPNFDDLRIT